MSRKIPNLSGVSTRFLRRKAHVEAQTPDSLMFLRDILKNKRDTMEAGMKKVLLNVTPRQDSHLYRALLRG